jgi:hypothetical protein
MLVWSVSFIEQASRTGAMSDRIRLRRTIRALRRLQESRG